MRKRIIVAVLLIGAFFLWKALSVTEEERIRRTLMDGKRAIEREDLKGVMKHISMFYRDDYGFTYLRVRALFQRLFEEFDDIQIFVDRMEVELKNDDNATATLLTWATARGKEGKGYIACSGQEPCRVRIDLEKGGGSWRVTRVQGVRPGEVFE